MNDLSGILRSSSQNGQQTPHHHQSLSSSSSANHDIYCLPGCFINGDSSPLGLIMSPGSNQQHRSVFMPTHSTPDSRSILSAGVVDCTSKRLSPSETPSVIVDLDNSHNVIGCTSSHLDTSRSIDAASSSNYSSINSNSPTGLSVSNGTTQVQSTITCFPSTVLNSFKKSHPNDPIQTNTPGDLMIIDEGQQHLLPDDETTILNNISANEDGGSLELSVDNQRILESSDSTPPSLPGRIANDLQSSMEVDHTNAIHQRTTTISPLQWLGSNNQNHEVVGDDEEAFNRHFRPMSPPIKSGFNLTNQSFLSEQKMSQDQSVLTDASPIQTPPRNGHSICSKSESLMGDEYYFVEEANEDEEEEDANSSREQIEKAVSDAVIGQPSDQDACVYFCHRCNFTSYTRENFEQHLRAHYDHKCAKCDYTSRTEGRLRRHMKDFHSDVPPENFSGKVFKSNRPKVFRCKQCSYFNEDKNEFWHHLRSHIKPDKRLECSKCLFVTEYKHHLEYHMRNHAGTKPYKCGKCNYECVNKSMLNSHMKSHSNVYPYRCANCSYATKYCHSLKLHLAKQGHKPALILNADGSMPSYDNTSELLAIRRGVAGPASISRQNKMAAARAAAADKANKLPSINQLHSQLTKPNVTASNDSASLVNHLLASSNRLPLPLFPSLNLDALMPPSDQLPLNFALQDSSSSSLYPSLAGPIASSNTMTDPLLAVLSAAVLSQSSPTFLSSSSLSLTVKPEQTSSIKPDPNAAMLMAAASQLNSPTLTTTAHNNNGGQSNGFDLSTINGNRLDLDQAVDLSTCSTPIIPATCNGHHNATLKVEGHENGDRAKLTNGDLPVDQYAYECQHCEIKFRQRSLYDIHMGFHSRSDAFLCNRCGWQGEGPVDFFTHLFQMAHNS